MVEARGIRCDEVFVATIGPNVSAGRPTTKLPVPTTFGEAVAVDDWVFVVGGREQVFGAEASTRVFAAQVGVDGELSDWQETASPMGRTNHEVVAVGDFLVSVGGAAGAGGDANVLVSRARFAR